MFRLIDSTQIYANSIHACLLLKTCHLGPLHDKKDGLNISCKRKLSSMVAKVYIFSIQLVSTNEKFNQTHPKHLCTKYKDSHL